MTPHKTPLNRRQVLGATAGALAFPSIIPSSVLGRGNRAAAGERITVAMIGCGKMANDYHIPTLLGFGDVQVVAVSEVDKTRREAARERVNQSYKVEDSTKGCAATADFRDLIGRKRLPLLQSRR